MQSEYIVAEISKTWSGGETEATDILSTRFEDVINKNVSKGYTLLDWKLNVYTSNGQMVEMIIAVFALPRMPPFPEKPITY